MNETLNTLESRIQSLVGKINQLRSENRQLSQELAYSRKTVDTQAEQLAKAKEETAQTASAAPVSTEINEDLDEKLQFQEQQIQLLEKERLNLRDQISFLQNTIQNKDKGWKEKFGAQERQQSESQARITELQEQLQAAEDSALVLRQELNSQKQRASEEQGQLNQSNQDLQHKIDTLQTQLDEAQLHLEMHTNDVKQLSDELKAAKGAWEEQEKSFLSQIAGEQDKAKAQLEQEKAGFQKQLDAQAEKHERELDEAKQALQQQTEQLKQENADLLKKMDMLKTQNRAYRLLLEESAQNIRALLERLPASDDDAVEAEVE